MPIAHSAQITNFNERFELIPDFDSEKERKFKHIFMIHCKQMTFAFGKYNRQCEIDKRNRNDVF